MGKMSPDRLNSTGAMLMTDDKNTPLPQGPVMTTAEVMEWLGISRAALMSRIQSKDIPASRIGSEYRLWRPLLLQRLFGDEEVVELGRDVITPADLADYLQLNTATVRQRIADGSIPATKIGSSYRIRWPKIRARLEAGEDFLPTPSDTPG